MTSRVPVAASVIIPLYQDAETIGAVLESLAQQERAPPFEIIVVDDGSTDAGPDIAGAAGVRVISQPNAGPAAARNRGAAVASGAILLFLDADCLPPPHWLATMTAAFDEPGVAAIMGTIGAQNRGVVPIFVQLEVEGRYARMRARPDSVDFIAAPNCGVRRDVFTAIGGFDAHLRQAEDVEIAYRLRAGGHRIRFVDTAPVSHLHQPDWHSFLAAKLRRAVGRAEVLARYPGKAVSDRWTPPALKAQFLMALAVPPLLLLALTVSTWFGVASAACIAGVAISERGMIAGAAAALAAERGPGAGAPSVADRAMALAHGTFFLVARAFVIVAAVLAVASHRLVGGRR